VKSPSTAVPKRTSLSKINPKNLDVHSFFDKMPGASSVVETFEHAIESSGARLMSRRDKVYSDAREQGHALGYSEGHEAGFATGRIDAYRQTESDRQALIDTQIHDYVEFCRNSADQFRQAADEWFTKSEEALAGVAIIIAERLLRRQLDADPQAIVAITREAIQEITHATTARITVNPYDAKFLEGHQDALLAASTSLKSIEIICDANVRAGCIIQTDGGSVDATLDTHLRKLIEEVLSR
jgi:flagellar assembly protein FliH